MSDSGFVESGIFTVFCFLVGLVRAVDGHGRGVGFCVAFAVFSGALAVFCFGVWLYFDLVDNNFTRSGVYRVAPCVPIASRFSRPTSERLISR